MKKLYANLVCMFVFSDSKKRKIRMNIRYHKYIKSCISFVRSINKDKKCKLKQFFGYGCKNMMVSLNKKWIFKFPLPIDEKIDNSTALREKRIYDAFKHVSPINIPTMKLLNFGEVVVRRYKFIEDCDVLADVDKEKFEQNRFKIAKQIANFLYVIGKTDPKELYDLKPVDKQPEFLYGWCQNDIGGNFLIDKKTMDIKYFIDWEDAQFICFKDVLYSCAGYWEKLGYGSLIVDVLCEYGKMYISNNYRHNLIK